MRNYLVIAALLVSNVAHAELVTKRSLMKQKLEPAPIEAMLAKINSSYKTKLVRCYNKGLSQDASLGGKVTITFTVTPHGRVSGSAEGIAPKVDACLTNAITNWRFPTATPRKEATFRIRLQLAS